MLPAASPGVASYHEADDVIVGFFPALFPPSELPEALALRGFTFTYAEQKNVSRQDVTKPTALV